MLDGFGSTLLQISQEVQSLSKIGKGVKWPKEKPETPDLLGATLSFIAKDSSHKSLSIDFGSYVQYLKSWLTDEESLSYDKWERSLLHSYACGKGAEGMKEKVTSLKCQKKDQLECSLCSRRWERRYLGFASKTEPSTDGKYTLLQQESSDISLG